MNYEMISLIDYINLFDDSAFVGYDKTTHQLVLYTCEEEE